MKEKSYMLALPGEQEPEGRMEVLRRLKNAPDFKVVTADTEDEGSLEITVEYKGNRYRALLYPTGFELPEFYRCQHLFPDVDIEVMERAESGLAVEMMFGEDALDSYHLQLKLIHAVLPDAVAVLDDSSEKILSGHWVALIPPAPYKCSGAPEERTRQRPGQPNVPTVSFPSYRRDRKSTRLNSSHIIPSRMPSSA